MTEPTWLIDKSALARLAHSLEPETWSNRIERGLVHISNVTRLEVGYSTQSGDVARREFRESPLAAMPVEYLTPIIEDRALEIQLLLADRGQHRGPSIPDLIIAEPVKPFETCQAACSVSVFSFGGSLIQAASGSLGGAGLRRNR